MNPKRNELVTVYTALGRMEAEVVRGRLAAENIPAMLAYESVEQTFGVGQVQVKVPAALAEQARAIIEETS